MTIARPLLSGLGLDDPAAVGKHVESKPEPFGSRLFYELSFYSDITKRRLVSCSERLKWIPAKNVRMYTDSWFLSGLRPSDTQGLHV